MESAIRSLIVILIVVAVALFVVRSCKKVDIRQKSSDDKTSLTVDIQKTPEPRY